MISLIIILFTMLLVINIYYFFKAISTKKNDDWVALFTFNISSVISALLTGAYSLGNNYLGFTVIVYFIICAISFALFSVIFLINVAVKIVEILVNPNTKKKKNNRAIKLKYILVPFILTIFLTGFFCTVDYSKYDAKAKEEQKVYDNIKNEELSKMVKFINEKYSLNIQKNDYVYYRAEDYSHHSDIFGRSRNFEIPYITVFKVNNEEITVADRKGFISDNKQLKEINDVVTSYFNEKTGYKFDYVEFTDFGVSSKTGNNNVINRVLQTKFNKYIDNQSMEEFLSSIFNEPDLSISFYIKNSSDISVDDIQSKLEYLKSYSSIKEIIIYTYDGELSIDQEKIDFPDIRDDKKREYSDDYSDYYKFGCYYIKYGSNNKYIYKKIPMNE